MRKGDVPGEDRGSAFAVAVCWGEIEVQTNGVVASRSSIIREVNGTAYVPAAVELRIRKSLFCLWHDPSHTWVRVGEETVLG
jgi:hypothetical protein